MNKEETIYQKLEKLQNKQKKSGLIRILVLLVCLSFIILGGVRYLPQVIESRKMAEQRLKEENEREIQKELKLEILNEEKGKEDPQEEQEIKTEIESSSSPSTKYTQEIEEMQNEKIVSEQEQKQNASKAETSLLNNNCNNESISQYQQKLLSAKTSITTAQEYISNPSCDSVYSPSRCQLSYDICNSDVENWFKNDGTCSRLPRSGMCDKLKVERANKLNLCTLEYNDCNTFCEEQISNRIIEKYLIIEENKATVKISEEFLKNCGVNL